MTEYEERQQRLDLNCYRCWRRACNHPTRDLLHTSSMLLAAHEMLSKWHNVKRPQGGR